MKSCRPFDQDSCSSLRLRQSAQEPVLPTKTLVHPKQKLSQQDSGLSECVGPSSFIRVLCLLTDHRPRKSRGCDKKHRKSNSSLKAEDRRTAFCPIALARCYRHSLGIGNISGSLVFLRVVSRFRLAGVCRNRRLLKKKSDGEQGMTTSAAQLFNKRDFELC